MPKKKKNIADTPDRATSPPLTELVNPTRLQEECNELKGPESIEEILSMGHWIKHEATKKHIKWKRYILLEDGTVTTCTITFSSTPGDKKAWQKQRANLIADEYHFRTAHECGGHKIKAIIKKEWIITNLC